MPPWGPGGARTDGARLLEAPQEEQELGIAWYATAAPGAGGRIKEEPEDFVVVERTKWPRELAQGAFLAMEVRARNWETNRLVGRLARSMHLSRARVGFAGTKDKRAVTTQGFTVRLDGEAPAPPRLPDVEVLRSFRAASALTLGDLEGNAFEIQVVGVEGAKEAALQARLALEEAAARGGVPNFFGTQRFGALRPVTHKVGAALVDGDYAAALAAYIGTPSPFEPAPAREARKAFRDGAAPSDLLRLLPAQLSFERQMAEALVRHPDDPLGALLTLPRNLVLMFVHAHQSQIFNRVVSARMARGLPLGEPLVGDLVVPLEEGGGANESQAVPVTPANLEKVRKQVARGRAALTGLVPGAQVPLASGAMGEIEREVLEGVGRTPADFVLPDLPRYTTNGVRRPLTAFMRGLSVEPGEVRGRPGVRLAFYLARGSYATVVLREVLKRPESAWAVKAEDDVRDAAQG